MRREITGRDKPCPYDCALYLLAYELIKKQKKELSPLDLLALNIVQSSYKQANEELALIGGKAF
jgi:hypothetical protein